VNYKYVILSYKNEGKDFKEYELAIEDKFITDVRVAALPNGDLACAGFYSDKGTFSIKGSCFLRVNGQTGELMKVSSSEFGIDFITQNMTERQEAKAKKKEVKKKIQKSGKRIYTSETSESETTDTDAEMFRVQKYVKKAEERAAAVKKIDEKLKQVSNKYMAAGLSVF
jgi:hypothetical protein